MWISDLFMKRVEENSSWTLMCPNECQGFMIVIVKSLKNCTLSTKKPKKKTIQARELWDKILESQIETGTPICCKDAANRKSNQKNLGTIRSSNLCTEILEYTSKTKLLFAISPPLRFQCLLKTANSITKNCST